ncbi:MAG: cytochrome c3 family protein [Thermacetogeniaceae bacterium]
MNEDQKKKGFNFKKIVLIAALVAVVVGAGGGIYMLKASDNPEFCSSCHLMVPYYESWNESNLLAHKHAVSEDKLECHDCHEPTLSTQIEEGVKFITGNYQVPLEKREFPRDFCLECHDDWENIVAATDYEDSNPHDSHYGEQECHLCHNMHQQSVVMCAECHYFKWMDELDDSWTTEIKKE